MAENGKNLQVTIIVPTKNELEGIKWFMGRLKKEWYDQLIIMDAGSTDGTLDYCRQNNFPVYVQSGPGLTVAMVDALRLSTKDIIVTLSPDGNSIPELIPDLVAKMREGYDMTIVSRYMGGAKSEDDDFFTGLGNKFFTWLVNLLFGSHLTDVLVIFRAYRRDAMFKMGLDRQSKENALAKKYYLLNSWEIASACRVSKLGLKVAEIPGDEPKRMGGNRKLSVVVHGTAALLQVLYEWVIGKSFLKIQDKPVKAAA
jgi:glycosyltransferase involved in cell wall biosynthesis